MALPSLSHFEGTLLGLALGDAYCAPVEGGLLERAVWRFIGRTRDGKRRWTDDTQMSLDLAASLTHAGGIDQEDAARRFAGNYKWSRGYGPGAAKILKLIRKGVPWREARTAVYAEGSYGNGAAMRAAVVGLAYADRADERDQAARQSAEITHSHVLAIDGARLVAHVVAYSLADIDESQFWSGLVKLKLAESLHARVELAASWSSAGSIRDVAEVKERLGNGMAATDSVVTAVYIARSHRNQDFASVLRFARSCGGDTDTIAAMAGAVWGALQGVEGLPDDLLLGLEQLDRIRNAAAALHGFAKGATGREC